MHPRQHCNTSPNKWCVICWIFVLDYISYVIKSSWFRKSWTTWSIFLFLGFSFNAYKNKMERIMETFFLYKMMWYMFLPHQLESLTCVCVKASAFLKNRQPQHLSLSCVFPYIVLVLCLIIFKGTKIWQVSCISLISLVISSRNLFYLY